MLNKKPSRTAPNSALNREQALNKCIRLITSFMVAEKRRTACTSDSSTGSAGGGSDTSSHDLVLQCSSVQLSSLHIMALGLSGYCQQETLTILTPVLNTYIHHESMHTLFNVYTYDMYMSVVSKVPPHAGSTDACKG